MTTKYKINLFNKKQPNHVQTCAKFSSAKGAIFFDGFSSTAILYIQAARFENYMDFFKRIFKEIEFDEATKENYMAQIIGIFSTGQRIDPERLEAQRDTANSNTEFIKIEQTAEQIIKKCTEFEEKIFQTFLRKKQILHKERENFQKEDFELINKIKSTELESKKIDDIISGYRTEISPKTSRKVKNNEPLSEAHGSPKYKRKSSRLERPELPAGWVEQYNNSKKLQEERYTQDSMNTELLATKVFLSRNSINSVSMR